MGANCQPCSSCRTAEGAKRHRSQGGKERGWGGGFGGGLPPVLPKARSAVGRRGAMLGVAPPRRKGGSGRYRHWLLRSLGDGEGAQLQWRSQKFVKGAGVRVQTVGRAAAAGRPMAQSAVGLNGGGARRGCGFWWGSPSFVKGFGVIPRDSLPPTPGTVLPSYTPRYERRSFPPESDYAECDRKVSPM